MLLLKWSFYLKWWRSELINYSGDLMTPPDQRNKAKTTILSKKGGKTIKGGRKTGKYADDDDSSDDNDWWSKPPNNAVTHVVLIPARMRCNCLNPANYILEYKIIVLCTFQWQWAFSFKSNLCIPHFITWQISHLTKYNWATFNSFRVLHGLNVYSSCKYTNCKMKPYLKSI